MDDFEYLKHDISHDDAIKRIFILENALENLQDELALKNSVIEKLIMQIDMIQGHNMIIEDELDELSETTIEMQRREDVLNDFLKKHDFGIEDIDEFITSLKVEKGKK